VPMCYTLQ